MLDHLLFQITKEAHELMDNNLFVAFAVLVGFDYITGVLKAAGWKVADSSVGMKGLIKHSLVFTGIILFWLFAESFKMTAVASGLTIFYIANYGLSIMENLGVMGIPYPKFLKTKVEAELKRYDEQLTRGVTSSELKAEKQAVQLTINDKIVETGRPVVQEEKVEKADEPVFNMDFKDYKE